MRSSAHQLKTDRKEKRRGSPDFEQAQRFS
jgi:hypothetical protein